MEQKKYYLLIKRIVNAIKSTISRRLSKVFNRPIILGKPSILMIEPTNTCQLHCPQCFVGQGTLNRARGIMKIDDFASIIADVEDSVFFLMLFYAGEPFLNPNLIEMIQIAQKSKINVLTSTNGQVPIDFDKAIKIVKSGIDRIVISMPGLTRQSYDLYNSGGDFSKSKNFIELLSKAKKYLGKSKPIIDIELLLLKTSEEDIKNANKIKTSWGADVLTFKTIFLSKRTDQTISKWLPKNQELIRYHRLDNKWVLRKDIGQFCNRLWQIATIYWNGDMAGCCCDQQGKRILGNILTDGGLGKVWQGKKAQDFRKEVMYQTKLPSVCQNCTGGLLNFYISSDHFSLKKRAKELAEIYGLHFKKNI